MLFFFFDVGIGVNDACIGGKDVEGDLAGGVHVITVADAHAPFHTVIGLGTEVLERTGSKTAVGDDDAIVIIGIDDGVEDLNLAHGALQLAELDVVAHLVRFQQEDEDASSEVLQRSTQCHTDGDTGTGEDGDEGTGLNT